MKIGINYLIEVKYVFFLKSDFFKKDEELEIIKIIAPHTYLDFSKKKSSGVSPKLAEVGEIKADGDYKIIVLTKDKEKRVISVPFKESLWGDVSEYFAVSPRGKRYLLAHNVLMSLKNGFFPQSCDFTNFLAFEKEVAEEEIAHLKSSFYSNKNL